VNLSEKQKEIVYADDGAIYVEASAGSGKTRVITERIRYLLTKTKKQILALTFTNKAGQEIKDRLKESNIENVDERLFVGTFHKFCQYVLEHHGSAIGLSPMPHIFEESKDRLELMAQAIEQVPLYWGKYNSYNEKEKNSFNYRALDFISKVKRELISENDYNEHTKDENIITLYKSYQDLLRVQNGIDFDDLLLLTYKLFINFPRISALYRRSFYAICIDEAQDLNNAQYKLLLSLVNGEFKNVMMVGDPNQSIFHFTGSDSSYMSQKFKEDFLPREFILNENYRSSKKVLEIANKLLPNQKDTPNVILEGEFILQACKDEFTEAEWIVEKIKELIERKNDSDIEGEITYEKIAILARNKYVFKELENKLEIASIAHYYKMTPGAIEFETEYMKLFDLALRLKLNSQDILHKEQLLKALKLQFEQNHSLETIIGKLDNGVQKDILQIALNLNDDGSNIKSLFEIFKKEKEKIELENDEKKKMLFNDIDELLEHWHNYATQTDNKSLHQFKNSMALGQTHSLKEYKGVTLSTVHTMKGQEYDIVFLMGMDEGTFPDYRAKSEIELNQEKNNLYVAFTRAKRFLYVTYPQKRTMPWGGVKSRNISRFLEIF
jgi:DNA helicase-2/ATP-dependent DNA helicase PcrA